MSLKAAWVPGLPHLLSPERSRGWQALAAGFSQLGRQVQANPPDVLVIFSSQWFGVLGTSFQTRERLQGTHVDENWYEWGDLKYDFKSDRELSLACKEYVHQKLGLPTRSVDFDAFPIDTGTILVNHFLNPGGKIPVVVVSTWVYADAAKAFQIGEAVAEAVRTSGKRAVFVASSLLSARYTTQEIDPEADRFGESSDDQFNQKILKSMETGEWESALATLREAKVPLEMQFHAFHWLRGTFAGEHTRGSVLAYGPLWGTGAAVVGFEEKK